MVAKEMELLGVLVPDVGRLTNRMWCYFAMGVTCVTTDIQREDEIAVIDVSERDALSMAADGRISCAEPRSLVSGGYQEQIVPSLTVIAGS